MAHPDPNFLPRRRLLLAGGLAFLAHPALADVGPGQIKGAVAKFELVKVSKRLPNLEFLDADDKPLLFSNYRGKAILVNFWATWCAPCVKEMPSLDRLQAAMGKDKFIVIPLSLDGPSRPKVAPFYEEKNLSNLGIYFDKGRRIMQSLDVSILPTSILVDRSGREIGRLEGEADWDKPEAIALMKAAVSAG